MARNLLEETTKEFRAWANVNGVGLEHEDDWGQWWDCWFSAYRQAVKDFNKIEPRIIDLSDKKET